MKTIFYFSALLCISHNVIADSNYKDTPVHVDRHVVDTLEAYRKKAISTLPYFDKKLSAGKDREYFVTTRLYKGEKYEQIFVKVHSRLNDGYFGKIASEPMGDIEYKNGDDIQVSVSHVTDWLIVKNDGSEEGNLQGKVLDLYRAGLAAFIYELIPGDGVYSKFKVISVKNGRTEQEIIEIVPADVIKRIEKHAAKVHRGKKSVDGKKRYSYTIVNFPGWEIRPPDRK